MQSYQIVLRGQIWPKISRSVTIQQSWWSWS